MGTNIKVRYLSYEGIGGIASNQLIKYDMSEGIPIEIEKLLDNQFKINIIPFPNLYNDFKINAFTSSDLKKIYVDENLYENLEPQYRFTLAHEYGHMVLHGNFYRQFKIKDIESYVDFLNSIDRIEYGHLEYQANCFAGHFLIPSDHLERQFKIRSKSVISYIRTKFINKRRANYLDFATTLIADKMMSDFKVHSRPIQIRIEKDSLQKLIP